MTTTKHRTEDQPTIGQLLERARKEKGLSQRKAADELGTTPTTYRSWLRGQVPGFNRVSKFVEFTGQTKLDILLAIVEAEERAMPGQLRRPGVVTDINSKRVRAAWADRPIPQIRQSLPATGTESS